MAILRRRPAGNPGRAGHRRAFLYHENTSGRYTFHDLLRACATELAHTHETQAERAAVHRILDHYLHTAHTVALLLDPSESGSPFLHPDPA
jgi:hypothetical protein